MVRNLPDDTSLTKGFACNKIEMFKRSNVYNHFYFVPYKYHFIITPGRFDCDDWSTEKNLPFEGEFMSDESYDLSLIHI